MSVVWKNGKISEGKNIGTYTLYVGYFESKHVNSEKCKFLKNLKKMGQNTSKHTPKIKITIKFMVQTYFCTLYKKLNFFEKKPKK